MFDDLCNVWQDAAVHDKHERSGIACLHGLIFAVSSVYLLLLFCQLQVIEIVGTQTCIFPCSHFMQLFYICTNSTIAFLLYTMEVFVAGKLDRHLAVVSPLPCKYGIIILIAC